MRVINCQYKYNDNKQKHIIFLTEFNNEVFNLFICVIYVCLVVCLYIYPVRYLSYIVLMLGQSIYYHLYLIIKYKTPTECGVHGHVLLSICPYVNPLNTYSQFQETYLNCVR